MAGSPCTFTLPIELASFSQKVFENENKSLLIMPATVFYCFKVSGVPDTLGGASNAFDHNKCQ